MSWTCNKCMKQHDTPEQIAACRRAERREGIGVILCLAAILAIMVGAAMAWNQYLYGDWKCAFAHCRKVIVEP